MNQLIQESEATINVVLPAISPPAMNAQKITRIVSWSEIILIQRNNLSWNLDSFIVGGVVKIFWLVSGLPLASG